MSTPVDWVRRINMDNRIKELETRRNAQPSDAEDDWDDETGIFGEVPSEPTRIQDFSEIQAQLAKAFGSTESRSIELDYEIWTDVDLEDLDTEKTEVTGG